MDKVEKNLLLLAQVCPSEVTVSKYPSIQSQFNDKSLKSEEQERQVSYYSSQVTHL